MARYLDRIVARFKRQEAKGISKYGQILEDNPRGVLEALEYLAEELTDGLMYVEEAIEKAGQADCRTLLKETEVRAGRAEKQLIKLQQENAELREEIKKYRTIECDQANKEVDGKCLGYSCSENYDEPIKQCKTCKEYTSYEEESEGVEE